VKSVIVGSIDTTVSAMATILLFLAREDMRKHRQRIVDEVFAATGDVPIQDVTLAHLNALEFTHAFLVEAMRLRPPLAQTFRRTAHDVAIPGTEFVAPAGWFVALNAHTFDDGVNFGPDPKAFDPERHLRERAHADFRGAVLPFSLGAHACPGRPGPPLRRRRDQDAAVHPESSCRARRVALAASRDCRVREPASERGASRHPPQRPHARRVLVRGRLRDEF